MGRGIRWPTVLFGALPATYLAFPAAVGILFGAFFSLSLKPMAFAILAAGALGWIGAIALWAAARSPGAVSARTALGLALGALGSLLYVAIWFLGDDLADRLAWWPPVLVAGPVLVAVSHLNRFLRAPSQRPSALLGEAAAQAMAPAPGRPETLRRVLKAMLIVEIGVGLAVAPIVLRDAEGWGQLFVVIVAFPFALAIFTTAIWAFWRRHELRVLATVVGAVLVLWPWFLDLAEALFGADAAARYALLAACALPALVVLLLPHQVVQFLPRSFVASRSLAALLVGLQLVMALPWPIVLFWAQPWERELETAEFWTMVAHTVASAVVGLGCLAFAYVGLFTQEGREHWRLSIISILLSLVLLALAAGTMWIAWLVFAAASVG